MSPNELTTEINKRITQRIYGSNLSVSCLAGTCHELVFQTMPWITSLSSSTICDDDSDGILGNEIVVEPHVTSG